MGYMGFRVYGFRAYRIRRRLLYLLLQILLRRLHYTGWCTVWTERWMLIGLGVRDKTAASHVEDFYFFDQLLTLHHRTAVSSSLRNEIDHHWPALGTWSVEGLVYNPHHLGAAGVLSMQDLPLRVTKTSRDPQGVCNTYRGHQYPNSALTTAFTTQVT